MSLDVGIEELLDDMRQRGIEIALDGDALAVRAPRGAMKDEEKRILAASREQLLTHLRGKQAQPELASFALTDIQQAYWVGRRSIALGNVGCHAYREFVAGDLDIARLEKAWQLLIDRHEMLRAVITEEGRQRILSDVPLYKIEVTDLRGEADARTQLKDLRASLSHRTFDPAVWPMFDIRVTRSEDSLHLHIGMDLLIADATSMLQLYREWSALYKNLSYALPPMRARFADYVQSHRISPAGAAEAAAYWTSRLPTLPGAPELPLAMAPTQIQHPRFTRHSRTLAPALWGSLCERARKAGLTPSNVLMAAYADILAKWSRHQHFLMTLTTFGAPAEYVGVVGDFTSTLLLEVDARPTTFTDRARALQSQLARDLDHQAWSGVRVMRELARIHQRMVDSIPVVFTSALGHRSAGESSLPLDWLGRTVHAITQTPQVWIDHHVIEDGDSLIASWDVIDELFPPGMIEAMFEAHGRLLEALAAGDEAWSATLGQHLPASQLALRQAANATKAALPQGFLQDGFFAWAAREPERPAVMTPDLVMSYGQLAAYAAAVAHGVRDAGVGRNQLVGVSMKKGWQQVATVLGILAAGAAYLPVDPDLPVARRRHLAEHGQISVVWTLTGSPPMEWPDGVKALAFDVLVPQAELPPALPALETSDLAYVLYTSGSTGQPKGVMIEHQAALNTITDINRRFGIGPEDTVFGLSSLSFDLSVFDIFGLLGRGGRLVLPAHERLRDPEHWLGLMHRAGVSVWNTVPALLGMLVEHGEQTVETLRVVMLSGDWVPLGLPARIKAMAPGATVYALGGATEASIWSNWFEVRRIEESWRSIPYGWPLANQSFHVLDDVLEPAPEGVPGRLFIAGAGLASGYWRDPERTAERFIHHPRSGERLYDTGDVGRYLMDGSIEFLGREDTQVKVRGHRIELGEIEARLREHAAVAEALVLVTGQSTNDQRLTAWVTSRPGIKPSAPDYVLADQAGRSLLSDPQQRVVWKLARHAVRRADGRGTRVALPVPADHEPSWQRRSVRHFTSAPMALEVLAGLLGVLRSSTDGADAGYQYRYPSAGSAYCVQAWVYVKPGRVTDLAGGFYYYHPDRHDLENVKADELQSTGLHVVDNRAAFEGSAFSLFLVSALDVMRPLYGEHARDFCLIEAGYMGQVLMQQAASLGLGICAMGIVNQTPLAGALNLGAERQLTHSFVGGWPAPYEWTPERTGGAARQGEYEQDLSEMLKLWSAETLPDYMVPDAVVLMDALPLTANGKIDRAQLPDPQLIEARETLLPEGPLEQTVAAIFAEVLGKAAVGRDDVVFDLGGTSVHVVRIHRRLMAQLSASVGAVDVVDVFRYPSVRQLSEHLSRSKDAAGPAADGMARAAARRLALRSRGRTPGAAGSEEV